MNEKIAILDTNILVAGIIKGRPLMEPIFSAIEHGSLLMGITKPIKGEYVKIFEYKNIEDETPITDIHREKLVAFVSFAVKLSDKNLTRKLKELDTNVINKIDQDDWRFVQAADMAAGYIGSLSYLISLDTHLLSIKETLKSVNIHAIHPKEFVEEVL